MEAYNPLTERQDAWVALASRYDPFDLFLTHTFTQDIHPEQADKRFYRFIHKLDVSLFGKRYREQGRGLYWFRALEYQRRGVVHFHSIVGGGAYKLLRQNITKLWENDDKYENNVNGDNGKLWVEKYDPTRGAKYYLADYLSKNGEIDCFVPDHIKKHFGIIPDANKSFKFLNA